MTRYFIYFLFIGLFASTQIKAQELVIDWGKEFDSKTDVQKILGFSGDKMVAYTMKGKKRYIETYDKDGFMLKSSRELVLPNVGGSHSGMLNLAITGDHVSAILYSYTKKTKSFSLFSQKIGLDARKLGKATKLYSSATMEDRIREMEVDVVFSPNGKRALVYFNRTDKKRTLYFTDAIVLSLDKTLEKVNESEYTFKIKKDKSDKVLFKLYPSIENDGSYNLIQEKIEYYGLRVEAFSLIVSRFDPMGKEIGSVSLAEDKKAFFSPTLIVKDDKILVVGYYMENPKNSMAVIGYSGIFTAEFSLDMKLVKLTSDKFDGDFMKKLYSVKRVARAKKKGKELYVPSPYTMDDLYVHKDGSMTVLSEYYTRTVRYDNGRKTTTTVYGNIAYFKISEAGEIISSDVVKKLQASSTVSISLGLGLAFVSVEFPDKKVKYWSYASLMDQDDNIYLVFNDHFKNEADDNGEVSRRMVNPTKSVPFLVTINADGEYTKEAMVASGDEQTYAVPQVVHAYSQSEFVILGVWRKAHKFGVATIK